MYAAYSLKAEHSDWKTTLTDIAKQEMGHLMTVQNLRLARIFRPGVLA